jgi:hypothetical protein
VPTTRRTRQAKKPISDKQRAADESLKEELKHFDVNKFDQLLEKAIKPADKRKSG